MPSIVLALAAVALAAAFVMLMWRGRVTVEPEAPVEPGVAPRQAAPRARAAVLAEAVPRPATVSGAVERPAVPGPVLVPPPPVRSSSEALDTLDALLAELESATVRIDCADALDEGSVAELEGLAVRLEAAAESLAAR